MVVESVERQDVRPCRVDEIFIPIKLRKSIQGSVVHRGRHCSRGCGFPRCRRQAESPCHGHSRGELVAEALGLQAEGCGFGSLKADGLCEIFSVFDCEEEQRTVGVIPIMKIPTVVSSLPSRKVSFSSAAVCPVVKKAL